MQGFDREALEKELRSLESPEACALIAARCALRVQPLLLHQAGKQWFNPWWRAHAENCCAAILAAWCHISSVTSSKIRSAIVAAKDAATGAATGAHAYAYAAAYAYFATEDGEDAAEGAASAADTAAWAYGAEADLFVTNTIMADLAIQKSAGPEGLRTFRLWPTESPSNWDESWQRYLKRLAELDGHLPELLQGIADGKARPEEVAQWLEGWFDRRQTGRDGADSSDAAREVDPQAEVTPRQDTTEQVLVQESIFINQGQAPEEIAGSGGAGKADPHAGDSPPGDATEARLARASLASVQPEGLASRDCLGRGKVVEALAQLVAEREGDRHLALGLFGPWGSGKSSTIAQLSDFLRMAHPEIRTAEFNAWKNEKATNLGAM
ncbi:MAG: hypothetical protein JNK92_05300, partial [Dechloromonas sp.]|nr:hypothetical protein [Dechloromonas sp.]